MIERNGKDFRESFVFTVQKLPLMWDYYTKLFKYQNAGVLEYWIVDPQKQRVTVYNFQTKDMVEYTFSDSVPVGIYPDLAIDFSGISQ